MSEKMKVNRRTITAKEGAPARRVRKTHNYAYPIVEAVERFICALEPDEDWNGTFLVEGDGGEPCRQRLPREVGIDDIEYLYMLEWDTAAEEFANYDQLICDALERSACELGYEWSNEYQRFVRAEVA